MNKNLFYRFVTISIFVHWCSRAEWCHQWEQ